MNKRIYNVALGQEFAIEYNGRKFYISPTSYESHGGYAQVTIHDSLSNETVLSSGFIEFYGVYITTKWKMIYDVHRDNYSYSKDMDVSITS